MPETKVVTIGEFTIGLIHGHQVIPWGDQETLAMVQRELDCDILISGHTHKNSISSYDGKFFINPGSATGAFSTVHRYSLCLFII
jgi:vacuolar protein sorting-associated protein 29